MERHIITTVVRRQLDKQAPVFKREGSSAQTTIDDPVIGRWALTLSTTTNYTIDVEVHPLEHPGLADKSIAKASGDARENVREALAEAITKVIEREADSKKLRWHEWKTAQGTIQKAISITAQEMAEEEIQPFYNSWR